MGKEKDSKDVLVLSVLSVSLEESPSFYIG